MIFVLRMSKKIWGVLLLLKKNRHLHHYTPTQINNNFIYLNFKYTNTQIKTLENEKS